MWAGCGQAEPPSALHVCVLTYLHAITSEEARDCPKPITMLGVRLPTALHRRLRLYAVKRGVPVQRLIVQAVRELLGKE